MSRTLPFLAELQPGFFCEVSPELAAERGLEHLGWATIVTARAAIEARVLVTERMRPLRLGDRVVHQVGLPYHWGGSGLTTGDSANDLVSVTARPERPHPGQGRHLRHPAGPSAARPALSAYVAGLPSPSGHRPATTGGEPDGVMRNRCTGR